MKETALFLLGAVLAFLVGVFLLLIAAVILGNFVIFSIILSIIGVVIYLVTADNAEVPTTIWVLIGLFGGIVPFAFICSAAAIQKILKSKSIEELIMTEEHVLYQTKSFQRKLYWNEIETINYDNKLSSLSVKIKELLNIIMKKI